MMLVSRYGDREVFMKTFNPDYQRIICHDTYECFFGDYPTLATIKAGYGKNAPVMWLVTQLFDLSEYCGCKEKLSNAMLEQCAYVISTEYFYLKISELMLFFHRFKTGRYGRFYGSVDPLVITTSLIDFIAERAIEIDRQMQREREKKEAEHRKNVISYEEYVKMKQENENSKENKDKEES